MARSGALLRARQDDEVVSLHRDAVAVGDHPFERLAQGRVALGDRILQRVDGAVPEDFRRDAAHVVDGEGVGGGVARREGDDLRVGGGFQNLTHQRGLEGGHAVGKLIGHDGPSFLRSGRMLSHIKSYASILAQAERHFKEGGGFFAARSAGKLPKSTTSFDRLCRL